MKSTWYLWCILFCTPWYAHAEVYISEIAWMGTAVSANDEWIELHNQGSSTVSLIGWTLSDGEALHIELTGAVGPGEFIVLERTNDDSAPGSAFLIYTGALSNGGRILMLRNQSGVVVDSVDGSDGWKQVGGNNRTKETAQRNGDVWSTAEATPGAPNRAPVVHSSTPLDEEHQSAPTTTLINFGAVSQVPAAQSGGFIPAIVGLIGVIALGIFGVYAPRFFEHT